MSERNIGIVKGFYAAFGRGEIATIVGGTSSDIDWMAHGSSAHFPTLGPHKGPAGVGDFFRIVGETMEFSEFTPEEFYASGDHVFAFGQYTAKMRKTGRKASAHWAHVFTFRDGKVVKFREYTDTAAFAEAYKG